MPMKIYLSPVIENRSIDSLKINYAFPSNNPLAGVGQIPGSHPYLGPMYYRGFGRYRFFLGFALGKADFSLTLSAASLGCSTFANYYDGPE